MLNLLICRLHTLKDVSYNAFSTYSGSGTGRSDMDIIVWVWYRIVCKIIGHNLLPVSIYCEHLLGTLTKL
jgi:hypothetical protein